MNILRPRRDHWARVQHEYPVDMPRLSKASVAALQGWILTPQGSLRPFNTGKSHITHGSNYGVTVNPLFLENRNACRDLSVRTLTKRKAISRETKAGDVVSEQHREERYTKTVDGYCQNLARVKCPDKPLAYDLGGIHKIQRFAYSNSLT